MRRILLSVLLIGALSSLVGCKHCVQSHGICDCQNDDYCTSRSPWLRYSAPVNGAPIEAMPVPIPAGSHSDAGNHGF